MRRSSRCSPFRSRSIGTFLGLLAVRHVDQRPDAVRSRAGHRHRRRRRDRRDRERRAHHGEEKLPPRIAADQAIRQVASALIAIVLVLCSVFVPVAFIGGVDRRACPAVRDDDRHRRRAVGHRGAHAHAGALCASPAQGADETHTTAGFFGWFNRGFARAPNATSAPSIRCSAGRGVARRLRRAPGAGAACCGKRSPPRSSPRKTRDTWRWPSSSRRRVAAAHEATVANIEKIIRDASRRS